MDNVLSFQEGRHQSESWPSGRKRQCTKLIVRVRFTNAWDICRCVIQFTTIYRDIRMIYFGILLLLSIKETRRINLRAMKNLRTSDSKHMDLYETFLHFLFPLDDFVRDSFDQRWIIKDLHLVLEEPHLELSWPSISNYIKLDNYYGSRICLLFLTVKSYML